MRSGLLGFLLVWIALPALAQKKGIPVLRKQVEHTTSDSSRIMLDIKLADKLQQRGELQQAMDVLKKSKSLATTLGDAHLIQQVNIHLAEVFFDNDEPDSTINIVNRMLSYHPQNKQKAALLNLLGSALGVKGKYQEALNKEEEARSLVDSVQHPDLYSRIELHLGATHGNMGHFGRAFKYHLRGIDGAEAVGDSLLLATGLNSLGVVFNDHKEYDKARFYLERSIEIEKHIGFKLGLLRAYGNLAISYHNLDMPEKAIEYYNNALRLHNEIRKDVPPFRILYNLGQLYKDTGKLDKAQDHYQQSLDYCKKAGVTQGLIYNYGGLANIAELRNDFTKAREYYKDALQIAQKIGAKNLQSDALQSLFKLEKGQHNYKKALDYHEQLLAVSDSLNKKASQEKIADSETKLSLRKQEEINRLLKEKQRQQEARLAFKNWLIAAGIFIIIIILISIFLLYRANREKQRINSELESQRNKLEELNKVKDKILAIIAHDLRSPLASMQGMIYLLREDELSKQEIDEMTSELQVSISQNISMIDNLLVWAREQMSGMAVTIEVLKAREVVEEVFDNYEYQAHHKGVELINDVAVDLKVRADRNLLKLILRNLVSNAIKFCEPDDRLTIATYQQDGKVVFKVKDTGIGIPQKKRDDLFSMNSGSRSGTNNEKGSGLGLHLCKEFVEKQDGEISVESEEGKGTTFIFSLPQAS